MSRMLDPQMFFRREQFGVAPGSTCLEIASGNGSASQWLPQKVAPTGHVVSSGIDTRLIERLALVNLEVRRFGVSRDALGDGSTSSAVGGSCTTSRSRANTRFADYGNASKSFRRWPSTIRRSASGASTSTASPHW
jgi:hypothetical protein